MVKWIIFIYSTDIEDSQYNVKSKNKIKASFRVTCINVIAFFCTHITVDLTKHYLFVF